MKMTRPLATVAALALTLPLAACSSDKSEDASPTSSATATTATAMASADAMASSSSAAPAASADGQEVTASTAGVTFLAPSNWMVLSDPSNLDENTLSAAAKAVGQDPAIYKANLKQVDLLVSSTEVKEIGSTPFTDSILVARQTLPGSQVPADEMSAAQFAKVTGASSMTKYEKVSTTNGEATVVHYGVTMKDGTAYGAVVFAPASDGDYAVITINATEASTVNELVTQVTSSVK
ncbi:hypothetical protein [Actinomyces marmotae]|uniref:Lipoprotein n=1 Tax=Actinomyces marmotae TaxID=2737173 RepID=A0A6M8BAA7_9ACTO|nr:hypothetical protein [Actinomyces marmotae]QKD80391.1 hypothetical protein HPC72_09375 [Actinomyces marmotae]